MSTLKSLARSYAAAQRRSESIRKSNTRESLRQFQQEEKAKSLQNASEVVDRYNEIIKNLTAMHREEMKILNWDEILNEPEPSVPQRTDTAEQKALHASKNYRPSLFDKLLMQSKSKEKKLAAAIFSSKQKDEIDYNNAITAHTSATEEWETMKTLAQGILEKDPDTYSAAVQKLIPFSSLPLGKNLNLSFEPMYVTVNILLNDIDDIPQNVYTLTSTGKLSEKNMPASKRNELYQDHICSSMIRAATEILSILPIEYVVVNGLLDMLKPSTGKMEEQAIASVAFVPETLAKLNLANVDPSDAFKNFIHQMKFSKTNGFQPVEAINAKTLVITSN